MSKYFPLLTALFLFINTNGFSQVTGKDCSTYYYATAFNHAGYTYDAQVVPLPHDEVAIGCIKGNIINVAKLGAGGNTVWDKLYNIDGFPGAQTMKGLLDVDGNLLFAAGNYFIKIDTNGNFLYGKTIQNNLSFVFVKMALLSNGDKVMMYSDNPTRGAILARFDKDLNTIKWCKYYYCFNPLFTDFCIDSDTIVFGGGVLNLSITSTIIHLLVRLMPVMATCWRLNIIKQIVLLVK